MDSTNNRVDKNNYYLDIADVVAERSTCLRKHYGAVIVNNDEVVSTGYNGAPRGVSNCIDSGNCERIRLGIPRGTNYNLCLAGYTVVKLLNGKYTTMYELSKYPNDYFWIYSVDETNGAIVPTLAYNARATKFVNTILRVHFDDGGFIDCTHDHRFMLRNLQYKEAQYLSVGESVMPCNYYYVNADHEYIRNTPRVTEESRWVLPTVLCSTHTIPTHKLVYEYFHNPAPKDYIIHHIDFNSHNNIPENLIAIPKSEHSAIHSKRNIELGITSFGTPEASARGIETQRRLMQTDYEFAMRKSQHGKDVMNSNWASDEWREHVRPYQQASGKQLSEKYNKDPDTIFKRKRGIVTRGISELIFRMKMANDPRIIDITTYELIRSDYAKTGARGAKLQIPKLETILEVYNTFEEALDASANYNHKVTLIEEIYAPQMMYDLSVSGANNFAVVTSYGNCVVVHNCKSCHSEQNAIISASRKEMLGGTLYLSGKEHDSGEYVKNANCCSICKRMIINAGISRVIIRDNKESYRVIDVNEWKNDISSLMGINGY